jgi:hypothetical protein
MALFAPSESIGILPSDDEKESCSTGLDPFLNP